MVTLPARAFNSFLHSPFVLPLKGSHLSEGVYIYVFPLLTSTGSMQTLRSNWALHFYLIFLLGWGGEVKSPISDIHGTLFIITTVRSPDSRYILFLQETKKEDA